MRAVRKIVLAVGLFVACVPVAGEARPPQWDKVITGAQRFKILRGFDREAVLDRETGLVWTRTALDRFARTWGEAFQTCVNFEAGGRRGFRLPTIYELQSLTADGDLPEGAPFFFDTEGMWSSTFSPQSPEFVMLAGGSPWEISTDLPNATHAVVCVRGGSGPTVIP